MAGRIKSNATIDKRGDLPHYSKEVSAFLDGKEKMLYGFEAEWARALLLFYRFMEDAQHSPLPEGAHLLDDLVGFARQLGTSAMIKRSDFDAAALAVLQQVGVSETEGHALLDAISDKSLQQVASEFDIGPGGLDALVYPVRPNNALRAIRSCMPCATNMTTNSLPRSVAGIMAATCLAELDSKNLQFALPACENGDAILGLFDAVQSAKTPKSRTVTASFFDDIGSALCKMSLASAGYDATTIQAFTDKLEQGAVPACFNHASYACVLATYEPFMKQCMDYSRLHRDHEDSRRHAPHLFTDPYPQEDGLVCPREEAFVWYCTSLLAENGVAALWMPAAFARGTSARLIGAPLLQENLLHAVIEFRQLSETNVRIARPMSLWIIKRGRKADDSVLLALLDGDGFNTYCNGFAEQISSLADMSLADNVAAQKAVELINKRENVDKCAMLVSPSDLLKTDTLSLRFIDYASPVDLARSFAKPHTWEEMVTNYKASIEQNHANDTEFLAALESFHKTVG